MKDTWVFGLGIAWVQAFSFLLSPCPLLSCVRGLGWWSCHATTRLLLWYHFSFTLLLPLDLRAEAPASPFPTFFLLLGFTGWHSCWASSLSTSLPLLNFYWATFLLCQPIPFLGLPWPISFLGLSRPIFFSLPLLLLWAFAKSFRLPRPNYYILTSYYLSGLLAFMPTLWIY